METIFDTRGKIVLDSTIIVLWFRRHHPCRARAIEVRRDLLDHQIRILIPDLALYELELSLRCCSSYTASKVDLAIHSLKTMGLQVVPVSTACLLRAIEIAMNVFTSLSPSYFLAVAERNGCQYWTADKEFHRRVSDWRIVRLIE